MSDAVDPPFPYPGGKRRLASWVIDHLPPHDCYVELFGGSAAVLLAKSRSDVEVYNDLNGHLTTFFEVLRDNPDALVDWLETTPYSRELHTDYRRQLYGDGSPPDDAVARAGMFYYLQRTSFGAKIDGATAYPTRYDRNGGGWRDRPGEYWDSIPALKLISRRFQDVMIENSDWKTVLDRYDEPGAVFYADPPYHGAEDMYGVDFDHARFWSRLASTDADWAVSYTDIPPAAHTHCLEDGEYRVITKESTHRVGGGDDRKNVTERLIVNYDTDGDVTFTNDGVQRSMDAFTSGDVCRSCGADQQEGRP